MMLRQVFIFLLSFFFITWGAPEASGSWLVDADRFHVSVHGQTACSDCHPDVDMEVHPDAAALNLNTSDFFDPETCADCHDSVEDYVQAGEHGGRKITSADDISNCLSCHDPHYQISSSPPEGFDPGRPVSEQCGACHDQQSSLPKIDSSEQACLECHLITPGVGDQALLARMCGECHNPENARQTGVKLAWSDLEASPHSQLGCLECHVKGASFPHNKQGQVECLSCHARHGEQTARDAHLIVSCQACHIPGGKLEKLSSGLVVRRPELKADSPSKAHSLTNAADENSCRRCHHPGNGLGAADRVLPAKGLICLACHSATLSVTDAVSIPVLLIFIIGLVWIGSIWMSGGREEAAESGHGLKVSKIFDVLVFDVLMQRRLWRRSRSRWLVHGLIFFPMFFRFIYGVLVLIMSRTRPDMALTWELLDKNAPFAAFFLDLTGIMILTGTILILLRKFGIGGDRTEGAPKPDWAGVSLLAAAVAAGFLLEGFRIALTGFPAGSEYSFAGAMLGSWFTGLSNLDAVFSWCWYIHAILWGGFVAYIPFSRMLHIIMAPFVLLMRAGREH